MKSLPERFQDPKRRENRELSVSSPQRISGSLHTFLICIAHVCAVPRAAKNHSFGSCARARNTHGKRTDVLEALVKGAFVQLGGPWQGRCQLCSSDTTCERGLGENYHRETQRKSSNEKPKPGQTCDLVEVANKTESAGFPRSTSSPRPELSPPKL